MAQMKALRPEMCLVYNAFCYLSAY